MPTIDTVHWTVAGLLAAFWLLAAGGNAISLIGAAIRNGSTSLLLFIAGIAGALSLLACPLPGTLRWAWVPALLDIGCIPAALVICHRSFTERRKPKAGENR